MATYAELKRAAETLPNRITAAVMDGDAEALAVLEQERATLPAALLAAELRELQAQIIEARAELDAAVTEERETRATTDRMIAEVQAAQARYAQHQRAASAVLNRKFEAREDLRRIKNRLEQIAAEQSYLARAAAAPVTRNLVGIPGPVRMPS